MWEKDKETSDSVDVMKLLYHRYVKPLNANVSDSKRFKAMQEAYWHYIDHLSAEKLSFPVFIFRISRPLGWSWHHIREGLRQFEREQRKLPRFGGLLLNAEKTHLLLIRAPQSKYWTLPAGKQEPGDTNGIYTAEREVKEEVGYEGKASSDLCIEYRRNGAPYTMYVFLQVPFNHRFKAKYPEEIAKIEWFPLQQVHKLVNYACKFMTKLQALLDSPHSSPEIKCSIEELCEEMQQVQLNRTQASELYPH